MRPDSRSFSFTWLRGQRAEEETTQYQRADFGSSEDLENQENVAENNEEKKGGKKFKKKENGKTLSQRGTGRLLRIGSSMLGNSLASSSSSQSSVKIDATHGLSLFPTGTIGSMDALHSNTMTSTSSSILSGAAENSVSISKRLNKTVQDVRASLGNFSQVGIQFLNSCLIH